MINPAIQDEKGRFKKGVSGNPKGQVKGFKRVAYNEMRDAIESFQEEHGVSYWKAATTIAMKHAQAGNVTLLCKIIDKFIPTKIEVSEEDAPDTLPFMVMGPHAN